MKPVFLVSDIHAGTWEDAGEPAKLHDFRRLLEHARREASELVLLGDVFDFWFEWRHVIPKRHFPWLNALNELSRAGIPVHIFPGNHDFRLEGFLEESCGLVVHGERQRREMLGRRVLLHHGDGIDPWERWYRLVRRLMRNRLAYSLCSWLHPDLGMRIADRASIGGDTCHWTEQEQRAYLLRALPGILQPGDEFFLMGHLHRACQVDHEGCRVVVLPPFLEASRGYAVFDGDTIKFQEMNPSSESSKPKDRHE